MASFITPYQRLAILVLDKALQDAWSKNPHLRADARRFLLQDSALLRFWCELAPVSIRTVRRAATQPPAIKKPYPGSAVETEEA